MSFIQDFKAFALKGNVVDMAVGVIIGGAFGKIVTSIVNNIIMPPIGGMMMLFTILVTILPNAPPIITPTAMSTTLPLRAKALKS